MNADKHDISRQGFTLVELMIALFISVIVANAIYWSYVTQRKIQTSQEAVVDMQQNARAGLYLITQELRMAGYDPFDSAGASIVSANATSINFTQDITDDAGTSWDGDGDISDANENITISYDAVNLRITRDTGGGAQPFLDNVSFFEMVYYLDNGLIVSAPSASQMDDIVAIKLSIIARASKPGIDPLDVSLLSFTVPPSQFFERNVAVTIPGTVVNFTTTNRNNEYRHRLLSTVVQCRNSSI